MRSGTGIKLGLAPVRALLRELGDPQSQGPRFVVVAGTNGKGTTSALIANALMCAGHRVGLYTSPHLLRFTERIQVDGVEIPKARVVALYSEICAVQDRPALLRPPTYFECVTAMALRHFADSSVDVAVLEVGLGGRLDATRAAPVTLSVVTPISLDHQKHLGSTIEEIAGEKIAIVAHGGRVVVAEQPRAAHAVIDRLVQQRRATKIPAARFVERDGELILAAGDDQLALPSWPAGAFQRQNVATAWTACRALDAQGIACPDAAFTRAAAQTVWPGRYQWVTNDLGDDLLLDAAHNAAGIAALCDAVAVDPRTRRGGSPRPLHCVFSTLEDKPGEHLAATLRPYAHAFYLCPIPIRRGRRGARLAALMPGAASYPDVAGAITAARAAAREDGGFALVTGSIFLVAEALAVITGDERDPLIPF